MSEEGLLGGGVTVAGEDEAAEAGGRRPVTELPLVIVVGLTGSGKSTTVGRLRERVACTLLPDRRLLADRVVLPSMQRRLGQPLEPVADRVERFRLTAGYRERHPGGLAHALSRLRVDPSAVRGTLIFDGLRGVDEVGWAADRFPAARFLTLHAPEAVRLSRLLERGDAFDRAVVRGGADVPSLERLYAEVPGLEALVPPPELGPLVACLGAAGRHRLAEKATILVAEAENYDPAQTLRRLEGSVAQERLLVIDTARTGPDEAAERVAQWLR